MIIIGILILLVIVGVLGVWYAIRNSREVMGEVTNDYIIIDRRTKRRK